MIDKENELENSAKKKTKRNRILAFTLIPLAIILAFTGGYFSRYLFHSKGANTAVDIISLIEQVGYIYDSKTGERRQITEEEIADALVYGLLDIYSAYYTEEEYGTVNAEAKGNMTGLGVTISLGGIISKVSYNSPAEIAGLQDGDKVLSVSVDGGQKIVYGENEGLELRNELYYANVNQSVAIEIDRKGQNLTFTMIKRPYVAAYVKYVDSEKTLAFRENENRKLEHKEFNEGMAELDGQTAYIRLTEFNGGAGEQIKQAFDYMRSRGKTKLIFDLRNNGGGYTDILEEVASCFINNGGKSKNLISVAKGVRRTDRFYTDGNQFNSDITAITLLANDNTASASECLIGAMLHYGDSFDQSKLIIEKNSEGVARTYGKGIMQTTYGLIGGGALKLTTAQIFLPDEQTSIHGVGFRADQNNAVEKGQAMARAIELLS